MFIKVDHISFMIPAMQSYIHPVTSYGRTMNTCPDTPILDIQWLLMLTK